ncbi:unnamed protein product [Cercospora beticola]|nr:unnamed protein product [Cercospora beticola]
MRLCSDMSLHTAHRLANAVTCPPETLRVSSFRACRRLYAHFLPEGSAEALTTQSCRPGIVSDFPSIQLVSVWRAVRRELFLKGKANKIDASTTPSARVTLVQSRNAPLSAAPSVDLHVSQQQRASGSRPGRVVERSSSTVEAPFGRSQPSHDFPPLSNAKAKL